MIATLQLNMNKNLFIRDPQETDLGKRIVSESIRLIDQIGFEAFTFKKLAVSIESTEASIYRYFENKHKLLIYLIAWYWAWLEYLIDYHTHNLPDAESKLNTALRIVSEKKAQDPMFPEVDEAALHRIVIAESDKTYLTKQVDADNKEGLFKGYKSLCKRIASYISEMRPNYQYPHSLVSTVLEAAHQQLFFAKHLPSLTEVNENSSSHDQNFEFLRHLVFKTISK
ncbi:MAG: TetR/AcrR family transcriptional regulator [Cyclobacteriaceae bacterium]